MKVRDGFASLASLPRLAIRRPIGTLMLFLALAACGALSWRSLPVELVPRFETPKLYVFASLPGASPDEIEDDLLRRLEGEIAALEGVEEISSRAETGQATITVSLERGTDLDLASLRIQQRLTAILPELSDQAQLFVQRFDTSLIASFVMELSLRGDADLETLRKDAEENVIPALQSVPGVVDVQSTGGASKQVAVLVDPERARRRGVTASEVRQALVEAARPVQAVGEAVDPARRLPVVLDGRATRLSDISDARLASGADVRVKDVADLQLALASSVEHYRIDGRPSILVTVRKDPQANLLAVASRLRRTVADFNAQRAGAGTELHVDFDGSKILRDTLDELLRRAATGAVLALLVLLIFLRDLRTVSVIAVAIPATLLVAADLFALSGMSVNVLSLLGLAVSVGLLLDNAIVVLESITRRRERGDDAMAAATGGVGLVTRAVMAGTATTLIVFVPLFIVQTDYSPIFRELALSVVLPLAASLLVAVTLLPMIAAKVGARWRLDDAVRWPVRFGAPRPGWARSAYSAILRAALRAPLVTCALTLGAVVAALVFGVPLVLVFAGPPREPDAAMNIRAELPAGTPIEQADSIAVQLEALARELPQVKEIRSSIREELVTVGVTFLEKKDRTGPLVLARERDAMRTKVGKIQTGATRIQVDPQPEEGSEQAQDAGLGALGGSSRETVRVKGPRGQPLTELAARVRDTLQQVPGVANVSWDVGTSRPTLEVVPDRRRLAELGLPPATILGLLWTTRREGERMQHGLRAGDEDIDLSLYVEGADARTIEDVKKFPLVTPQGELVPLDSVASVRTGAEPPIARRHQGERTITVTYDLDQSALQSGEATEAVRGDVDRALGALPRPLGHAIQIEHPDTEGMSVLEKMVLLGLALVFAVLACTFESATLPFLVLLAVPLAAVGVVASLALTGTSVNAMVILALVVLLGLVANQGILFIDRSEQLAAQGSRRATAILRAAHERLRPILMTTTATSVGLLPLAIDKGGEQEIWPPFARALLGGLVTGTLISLVFLPAASLLLGRLRDVLREMGAAWTAGATALCFGVLAWAYFMAQLVQSTALRLILAIPAWLAVVFVAHALRRFLRGELAPDVIGNDVVHIRVRDARKIYGGDPRILRDAKRVQRWAAIGEKHGMSARDLAPPAELRRELTWQAGALALLGWLIVQAQTTWGRLLLGIAVVLVLKAGIATVATSLAARGRTWTRPEWMRRATPLAVLGATWTLLFFTRRPGDGGDGVTLVFAAIGFAAWSLIALLARGGVPGLVARAIAPTPKLALDGVDLDFEPGLFGLLGPNGAGKSTLMRLVVNLYRPTRGVVTINDREVFEHAASLQPAIGFLPQFFGVPKRLTARQYLEHQSLLTGMLNPGARARRVEEVLGLVGLADRANEPMGGFSGGMRQRVGIARTLLNAPRIVVVDEPTVGLDPRERIRFRNLLADLAKDRVVLLSTHVVEDIGSACREVIVLDRGRILFRGEPAELTERARGRAWRLECAESELPALQRTRRIVSTTQLPSGRVLARGIGEPPEGASLDEPTLEDGYLLLLGRSARDVRDVA